MGDANEDGQGTAIADRVREAITRHGLIVSGERVVVGFSGGPDSLTLLHVLKELKDSLNFSLHAAHLNHGLRGADSDADALFAAEIAEKWGIAVTIESRDVAARARDLGLAIEEAARQERYGFLAQVAGKVGATAVAVGHNADDQVETVLMHFLRGSGLAGLRGMQLSIPLQSLHFISERPVRPVIRLVRPLLAVHRSDIERYCREQGLEPRFDRSNLDTTFFRNRLRHELIPYLRTYNPNIEEVIIRTASVVTADYDYLAGEVARAWEKVATRANSSRVELALGRFNNLHLSLKRSLLRRVISALRPGLRDIGLTHVDQAIEVLAQAPGAGVKVTLPGGLLLVTGYGTFAVATLEEDTPFLANLPQLPENAVKVPVAIPGTFSLGKGWQGEARVISRSELPEGALASDHPWSAYLDAGVCGQRCFWRGRRAGERILPLGLEGRGKKLSEFMIDKKIPASYRERYPVLANDEHILWLPGVQVDYRARLREDSKRILMVRVLQES